MEAHPGLQPVASARFKGVAYVPWVDHTRVAAFGFRFGANLPYVWHTLNRRV